MNTLSQEQKSLLTSLGITCRSDRDLRTCACGVTFYADKEALRCPRCNHRLKENGVDHDLYRTWSVNYNKKWPEFEDFYREVGRRPGYQYVLAGAVPGTPVAPGNVRWVEQDGSLPELAFDTLTDFELLMKDARITGLAAEAHQAYHGDPNSLLHMLNRLEKDHAALVNDNTLEWQLALENMARDVAVQKKHEADRKAADNKRGSQTSIAREFRNRLVPILALRMEEHHKTALDRRSGRHLALVAPWLQKIDCDYLTIAHITVTTVFDHIGRGSRINATLSKLFDAIGARLDHEAFFRFLKNHDPQAFSRIDRYVLQDSVKGYAWKVKESQAIAGVTYDFLDAKDRAKLGDWAFANFQSLTLWFETLKYYNDKGNTEYYLSLSEEGLKHRDLIQAAQDERAYEAWPMVHPPLEWVFNAEGEVAERGGYLTLHPGKYSTVIRSNKGTIPSEAALKALHRMQSVPMQINPFIYETMKGLLGKSREIGKFRTFERDSWDDTHRPLIDPQVWEDKFDENRNIRPEYKKAISLLKDWHQNREVAFKESMAPLRILKVAARFCMAERFYLPTYFDNRLRMYYMPDTLNPQGSDHQKSLLQFADGVEVTAENYDAVRGDLLVTMANCASMDTGNGVKSDKLPIEGRWQWAFKLASELEQEAKDPISYQSVWTECDEPFQFLAALREYYEIFVWGTSTTAKVPNGRDATNSGSQILGGIIRDPKTCFYCNVTTTYGDQEAKAPQDLYGVVAEEARALLRSDVWVSGEVQSSNTRKAKRIQELHDNGIENPELRVGPSGFNIPPAVVTRKVAKRPSMCTAYGASWRSKNAYVSDELDSCFKHPNGQKASLCEKIIVTNSLIKGQEVAFPNMERLNKWFKKFAGACLKADMELVHWKTPNGSFIVQEYREPNVERVCTYAMGGAKYFKAIQDGAGKYREGVSHISFLAGYSDEIKTSKTQTALAANWTHSHDATLVQNTIGDWEDDFFVVHDCFYGPAGTMEAMCKKAREEFYSLITSEPLQRLVDTCGVDVPLPPTFDAPIEQVLDNPFTFS